MELIAVNSVEDIPKQYRGTPIGDLLEYNNLDRPFGTYTRAELLVGMCMDHRKHLKIPENFSYIIRSGGANMRYSEFKISYAIGVGGVRALVIAGHNNCGMVNLQSRREPFVAGLVDAGWTREQAEEHFNAYAPMFEIGNAAEFVKEEARRLNNRYPKVIVAPMMYSVEDGRLYLVPE